MAIDDTLLESEEQMDKAVEFLKHEYRGVRSGRASTGLVEGLKVEVAAYGSTMTLRELANIAVAEGNVIVIKPYDPSTIKEIERAIEKSEVGINPQSDAKMIRLPVPALSTERRSQLAGRVKQLSEQQKVAVRNARRDANKALEGEKKAKTASEDEVQRAQDEIQKLTDRYCEQIDKLLEQKTREIMEV